MLRLTGMDAAQADALSKQVDWKSTFIFPFPSNTNNIHPVTIGGGQGLLMGELVMHRHSSKQTLQTLLRRWCSRIGWSAVAQMAVRRQQPAAGVRTRRTLATALAARRPLLPLEGTGQLTEANMVAAANSIR